MLPFGIGLHHAGLKEKDRKLVEELFVNQKIQVNNDNNYNYYNASIIVTVTILRY